MKKYLFGLMSIIVLVFLGNDAYSFSFSDILPKKAFYFDYGLKKGELPDYFYLFPKIKIGMSYNDISKVIKNDTILSFIESETNAYNSNEIYNMLGIHINTAGQRYSKKDIYRVADLKLMDISNPKRECYVDTITLYFLLDTLAKMQFGFKITPEDISDYNITRENSNSYDSLKKIYNFGAINKKFKHEYAPNAKVPENYEKDDYFNAYTSNVKSSWWYNADFSKKIILKRKTIFIINNKPGTKTNKLNLLYKQAKKFLAENNKSSKEGNKEAIDIFTLTYINKKLEKELCRKLKDAINQKEKIVAKKKLEETALAAVGKTSVLVEKTTSSIQNRKKPNKQKPKNKKHTKAFRSNYIDTKKFTKKLIDMFPSIEYNVLKRKMKGTSISTVIPEYPTIACENMVKKLGDLNLHEKKKILLVTIKYFDNDDWEIQDNAKKVAKYIVTNNKGLLPILTNNLTFGSNSTKINIIEILEKFNLEDINAIVPKIKKLLNNNNAHVRKASLEFLVNINVPNRNIYIVNALSDSSSEIRDEAIKYMFDLRIKDNSAIEPLINLFGDDEISVNKDKLVAILSGFGANAVPYLIKQIGVNNNSEIKQYSIITLGEIGDAEEAVPVLVKCLADKSTNIRELSARTLGRIGDANENVVNGLIKILFKDNSYEASVALKKLNTIKANNAVKRYKMYLQKQIIKFYNKKNEIENNRQATVALLEKYTYNGQTEKANNIEKDILPAVMEKLVTATNQYSKFTQIYLQIFGAYELSKFEKANGIYDY